MPYPPGKILKACDPAGRLIGEFPSTGDDAEDFKIAHRMFAEAGLHKDVRPQAEQVRRQANNFARVAFDLYATIASVGQKAAGYAAPLAVNAAFGIELYLKALALQQGVPLRGHKLSKLYEALPKNALEAIVTSAPGVISRHELPQVLDLARCVRELNDAYTKWRYSFEHDHDEPLLFPLKEALFLLDLLEVAFRQNSQAIG